MTDIGKAIEHFRYGIDCDIFREPVRTHARLAIAALREQAEREKGCAYCNGRFKIATHHINDAGMKAGTIKAALFCPMCGKRLEGEHENT